MLTKNISILIIILLFEISISAQEAEIKNIKKHYYDISEQINKKSLYCNEIELNKCENEIQNWPVTGNYYNKKIFWYNITPAHWDGKGKQSLQKIEIENIFSVHHENYEYLFKEGEFIFCFLSHKNISEHKYYYSKGKLIKYIEKLKSDMPPEYGKKDSELIKKTAEHLQNQFIDMF